jgi:hypothetical protein
LPLCRDAWSSRRGLSSQDAKQLYVESMLRVSGAGSVEVSLCRPLMGAGCGSQTLRKFADRPQAIALIEELESYSGDVAQRVMSGESDAARVAGVE